MSTVQRYLLFYAYLLVAVLTLDNTLVMLVGLFLVFLLVFLLGD